MTSRERVLTALSHHEPDRIPVTLAYETPDVIFQRYGKTQSDMLMRQDIYSVSVQQAQPPDNVRERFFGDIDLPGDVTIDAWGVARWRSPTGERLTACGPLRNAEKITDIETFPWPNVVVDTNLPVRVAELHSKGFAVLSGSGSSIFEQAWYMFGMERLLMALYTDLDLALCLFDKITELTKVFARQYAHAGVDILRLGDDISDQRGMMFAPEMWRQALKPRLAAVIAAARAIRPDIPVFYHTDGNAGAVIDDLIEVGVTILNPVQPEAINPFEIKKRYGSKLTLWGTIGTQTVLPFYTPEKVRRTVKEYCQVLGKGGGYVIAPTHSIEKDVPWENIVAFYQTVEEYGKYR